MIILIRNVRLMFFILCSYELLTSAKSSHLSFVFISMNAEYVLHNLINFYYILTTNKDYRKWWGGGRTNIFPQVYISMEIQ